MTLKTEIKRRAYLLFSPQSMVSKFEIKFHILLPPRPTLE